MYSFKNDYSDGGHPDVINALLDSSLSQEVGYGDDTYSILAKDLIKEQIGNQNAEVFFVSGGTQANAIVIAALLKPYEAVISAHTGHINIHEAGAIEATGHKVIEEFTENGKLYISNIKNVLEQHSQAPHVVKPKLVYISQTTEVGTVYTKEELILLSEYCKLHNLYLFVDGARLGSALTSSGNTMTLQDLGKYSDVFYIGGTKNGALFGEAIVVNNQMFKDDFAHIIKQRGGLLAKGRVLGVQFLALFRNELYFTLASKSNYLAEKLTRGFKEIGYPFLTDSVTNQIFPILPNNLIHHLSEKYGFYVWKKVSETESAVRLVTSRSTSEQVIDDFINEIRSFSGGR